MSPTTDTFYVTGGTLQPGAPSYVERQADTDLYLALQRGDYCYVLTARQMGKSSLMIHTTSRLREEGVAVLLLDLQGVGQNLTVEQWYDGLLARVGEQLDLEEELAAFWYAHPRLGPLQRWMTALREVVLARVPGRVIVFIDEIDAIRSLPFPVDEFFAGVRECYNRRTQDPEYHRLTFCLLGVAAPADLISDTRTSPFNIGRRIELTDFTEAEAAPLAMGLLTSPPTPLRHGEGSKAEPRQPSARTPSRSPLRVGEGPGVRSSSPSEMEIPRAAVSLLHRILHWTGGHPYLTQRLCRAVAEHASPPSPAVVDQLCEGLFFTREAREADDNLAFVRNRLLRAEVDLAALLDLYQRLRQGKRVVDDETNPLATLLRLSGVARSEKGVLRVRNRIYERVFDRGWVETHMPDAELRRQRAAYRRGVLRATAISGLVVAVMGVLALAALRAESRARRLAQAARAAQGSERAERLQSAQLLYAADMQLAARTWEDGNAQRTSALLAAHVPGPGQEDRRGFDWRYQWNLLHQSVVTFAGHGGAALLGAFAPDGHLVTVDEDLQVRHWDRTTRRATGTLDLASKGDYFDPALSHDGRTVAVRTPDGPICLFDTTSGGLKRTLRGHAPGVAVRRFAFTDDSIPTTLIFSPDDRWLISIGAFEGTARVWDVATGREIHRITGLASWTTSYLGIDVALSPDRRTLALAGYVSGGDRVALFDIEKRFAAQSHRGSLWNTDGTAYAVAYSPDSKTAAFAPGSGDVQLWDTTTCRRLRRLTGHSGTVFRLAFSPDGRKLATGGQDARVKVWDVVSGRELRTLGGHTESIRFLAFSPDGNWLASGSKDGTAKLWHLAPAARTRVLATSHVQNVAYSPDSRLLATGGGPRIKLWDVRSGRAVRTLGRQSGYVYALAFSPDGRTLASGDWDSRIRLWDVATGRERSTWVGLPASFNPGNGRPVAALSFSPDGKALAAGFGHPDWIGGDFAGMIKLWSMPSKAKIREFEGHRDVIRALVFSPDGSMMATGSLDRSVKLWQAGTWRLIRALTDFGDAVLSIAISRDGKLMAVGTNGGVIHLREVSMGRELRAWKAHTGAVNRLSFSPDARTLASGSADRTAKLWDVGSGRETRNLIGPGTNYVFAVAFAPDGDSLATTGTTPDTVQLWPAASWREINAVAAIEREAMNLTRGGAGAALARSRREAQDRLWRHQWSEALAPIDHWIQADPSDGKAHVFRGRALAGLKRPQEAEAEFARAVALRPRDAEAWLERGSAHARLGEWRQAGADFGTAVKLAGRNGMIRYRHAMWEIWAADPRVVRTIRSDLLKQVAAQAPEDPEVSIERGRALREARAWPEIVTQFTQAIDHRPDDPEGYIERAHAYAEMNRWRQAAIDFDKALALGSRDVEVWFEAALAQLGAGDVGAYRRTGANAPAGFGQSEEPFDVNRIVLMDALAPQSPTESAKSVRKAIKLLAVNPADTFNRFLLALAYYRAGDYEAALRHTTKARQAGDVTGWNSLLLALIHHHRGHRTEARRWLARGVAWSTAVNASDWIDRLRYLLLRREAEAAIVRR